MILDRLILTRSNIFAVFRYLFAAATLFIIFNGNVPAHDGEDPVGDDIADIPLFDAHMHYKREAWESLPVATVLSIMDKTGVAMALVSSTPDEGTIRLWEYAPQRIVPEVRPYRDGIGPYNWIKSPDVLTYLNERFNKYPHEGIGEFHIHQLDADDKPLLKQIATLAMKNKALVHLHSGAEPVKIIYALEPELTVIWAHAGMTEPPDVIGSLFARYEKLYVDTSYREYEIMGRGVGLDPEWLSLIMEYPERFMVGSDTWVNSQWADYEGIMSRNRLWLSKLPRNIAEMIAYKNAEKLFGRTVNKELLGKR